MKKNTQQLRGDEVELFGRQPRWLGILSISLSIGIVVAFLIIVERIDLGNQKLLKVLLAPILKSFHGLLGG